MPLKYLAGLPIAVMICGWVHGMLFIAFCYALYDVWTTAKWPFLRCVGLFIAALLPFGPFVADRKMATWEAEFQAQS